MGIHADDLLFQEISKAMGDPFKYEKGKPQVGNPTWIKSNGDTILIKDMDDNHLINCYNMCVRNDKSKHTISILLEEIIKRKIQL